MPSSHRLWVPNKATAQNQNTLPTWMRLAPAIFCPSAVLHTSSGNVTINITCCYDYWGRNLTHLQKKRGGGGGEVFSYNSIYFIVKICAYSHTSSMNAGDVLKFSISANRDFSWSIFWICCNGKFSRIQWLCWIFWVDFRKLTLSCTRMQLEPCNLSITPSWKLPDTSI